jgi:hypothetical protein
MLGADLQENRIARDSVLDDLNGVNSLAVKLNTDKVQSSNYHDSDSCRSFSPLKAIAKRLLLLFANAFKSVKERQL